MKTRSMRRSMPLLVAALALMSSGCGDEESGATAIIRTADGVQVISAEEAAQVTSAAAADEGGAAEGETAAGAPAEGDTAEGDTSDPAASDEAFDDQTASTVEVADDRDPGERMFDAFNEFRSCLEQRGTAFIGAPDPSGEGPTNDPTYIESLTVCAQQSDIVAVMEEAQSATENMTPEEVEERNEGVLVFVECMEGRGWTVEVTTGENGILNPTNMTGPNGESAFEGSDLEDCAGESQDAAETEGEG